MAETIIAESRRRMDEAIERTREAKGKGKAKRPAASSPLDVEIVSVPLTWLKAREEAQPRASIDPLVVREYQETFARAKADGTKHPFPPVVAFGVRGQNALFLADGFHRLEAARAAGKAQLFCEARYGTWADGGASAAVWYAAGANATHGLPRTNADKRTAVRIALEHENGRGKSDGLIAAHVGVSDRLVAIVRRELGTPNGSGLDERVGRDGKVRKVKAAADGIVPEALALVAETEISDEPAKLRQIARLPPERQVEVAQKLVEGVSLSSAKRTATDDYPTPRRAVAALLAVYRAELQRAAKDGTFLEPAAGAGELLDHVDRAISPKRWEAIDIRRPRALDEAGTRIGFQPEKGDFLERAAPKKKAAACVMNPPYSLAEAFVRKALAEAEIVFALLPITFLASLERSELLDEHPPRVCVLPERPSFSGDGATDAMDYAWFVWGDRRPATWVRLPVPPPEVLDDDPAVTEAREFELHDAMDRISREAGSCVRKVEAPAKKRAARAGAGAGR